MSKVLCLPDVAWCGDGGVRELWGVTGGRVQEGDVAGVDAGERAAAGQRGGAGGQHQWKDGHVRACRAIGIHSGGVYLPYWSCMTSGGG